MQLKALITVLFFGFLLASCAAPQKSVTKEQAMVDYDLLINMPAEPISYSDQIRPVLNQRCVVCHGCYDAPCQLKLSSMEGLQRGANPAKVYDGARIRGVEPTRLFIDAKSVEEWREKGFHNVLNEQSGDAKQNLDDSVLYQMLRLKQLHPQPRVGMLPEEFDVSLDRAQSCTTAEEFSDFAKEHPLWGMPYAMPNLSDEEYRLLVQWIAQGAKGSDISEPSTQALPQIKRWESFLNGKGLKQQLVSRYLYEHLFNAHIHFKGTSEREFYQLVRSRTAPDQPVDTIATARVFDDPGSEFYYRLVRYQASVVIKDHNVYEWSDQRIQRYKELFLEPEYQVNSFPSFEPEIASNPFRVFEPIPVDSRYRFLTDDAKFFIEGFIKGPVCRGQVALNVIEDHFWVFFVNPDHPISSHDPEFLNASIDYLQMPSGRGDTLNIFAIWTDYWNRQLAYMERRQDVFLQNLEPVDINHALNYIWDGEGKNPNAALTVYRHFDSASVTHGLEGNYPETAWVIDYPLFERIHYLLVAGFNVFGNVGHQLNTRLYMDFLRMEGETMFLVFMPVEDRKAIRQSWYQGLQKTVHERFHAPQEWLDVEVVTGYRSDDSQLEFYQHLENHLGKVAGPVDYINRCGVNNCQRLPPKQELDIDLAMRELVSVRGEITKVFPDVSFIRVLSEDGTEDLAYTLILNKAYKHVSSMFADEDQRDRSSDTLTVVKGLEGSYPNFFFVVDRKDLEHFVQTFKAIRDRNDYERFVAVYGIRRTNQAFWEHSDWFHNWSDRHEPLTAGIYDLNRYRNR
ncbi:MAG: fatty acid cis/trans isomerase [Gammaproteobacteria bacterium]|nr:fatty acid cis/trans isomerase [Gammaproteobacteria bacterium]